MLRCLTQRDVSLNGGFIKTEPLHADANASSSLVRCLFAGTRFRGSAHGSKSIPPNAFSTRSSTQEGVYRSSVSPVPWNCFIECCHCPFGFSNESKEALSVVFSVTAMILVCLLCHLRTYPHQHHNWCFLCSGGICNRSTFVQ